MLTPETLQRPRAHKLELIKVIDAPKRTEADNAGAAVPHLALPGIEVPIQYLKTLATKLSSGGGQDTFGSQLMIKDKNFTRRIDGNTQKCPPPTFSTKKGGIQHADDGGTGPSDETP